MFRTKVTRKSLAQQLTRTLAALRSYSGCGGKGQPSCHYGLGGKENVSLPVASSVLSQARDETLFNWNVFPVRPAAQHQRENTATSAGACRRVGSLAVKGLERIRANDDVPGGAPGACWGGVLAAQYRDRFVNGSPIRSCRKDTKIPLGPGCRLRGRGRL